MFSMLWCSLLLDNRFRNAIHYNGRCFMCAAFSNALYKREESVDSRTHTTRASLERNKMHGNYFNAKPKKLVELCDCLIWVLRVNRGVTRFLRSLDWQIIPAEFEVKMLTHYTKCIQVGRFAIIIAAPNTHHYTFWSLYSPLAYFQSTTYLYPLSHSAQIYWLFNYGIIIWIMLERKEWGWEKYVLIKVTN